jgi:hypothetical protein
MTPINAEIDRHSASFHGVSVEGEALLAPNETIGGWTRVTVFLLGPSRGRPLWTLTPARPGGTVRHGRLKRGCKQSLP